MNQLGLVRSVDCFGQYIGVAVALTAHPLPIGCTDTATIDPMKLWAGFLRSSSVSNCFPASISDWFRNSKGLQSDVGSLVINLPKEGLLPLKFRADTS